MRSMTVFRVALVAAASSLLLAASSTAQTQVAAATPPDSAQPAPPPQPNAAEMMRLRDGLAAAEAGDWAGVASLRDQAADPLVRRLLAWRFASSNDAPLYFNDIADALRDLQGWPGRNVMRQRAEKAIFDSRLTPNERIAFLRQEGGPVSGDGRIALAQALRQAGQRSEANEIARAAWRQDSLSPVGEAAATATFASVFSQSDYADRVNILVWRGERSAAQRFYSQISAADRAVAQARIALQLRQRRGLQRLVDAVPASRRDDPSLLYDRVRYIRRSGRPEDAMPIAARIDPSEAPLAARDEIYDERRLYVARALRSGQPRTAYRLVSNHGMTSGEDFADAEWISGWISLRFLHDPSQANEHFTHLASNVSAPVSRARALYWRAEAEAALGQGDAASAHLAEAANYPFTYYGQLAALKRGGAPTISLPIVSHISDEARARFDGRELVRALKAVGDVGSRRDFESIAYYLDDALEDPQEIELLSQMARDRAYSRTALRNAKAGLFRNVIATSAAYPLLELPPAAQQSNTTEPALVLAIIRQESEFEPDVVSHANAHGLMQILPSTARSTARTQGMDYDRSMLTGDPSYNITLGASYLGQLIDRYNGSYVLAVAAYNAGTSNVDNWIRDWGDPRARSTDVVDWVETIPFSETRNYVQRVMENLQVYRYRLAGQPTPIALMQDLRRGG
ncbi:MAG TPA: lytic transglycosylase domain-containing protein [Caulobacterales bacterium]|nr:lytic transglycosylase domain-containing protein [Caulobacterales bacterium]